MASNQLAHLIGGEERGLLESAAPEVRELACAPDLLSRIKLDLDRLIVGEDANKILLFIVGASAHSSRPLGAALTGSSSSGKSWLQQSVLRYFPNVIYFTRITGASLDRLERDMSGRILAIEELAGASAAQPTLRVWISEGQLRLLTTDRDESGRIVTREIVTKGVPAFITTTTAYAIDEETQNRLLVLSMDESVAQTKRILAFQARAFTDPSFKLEPDHAIKGFLETLLPWEVFIPFAEELTTAFPADTVRARRDLKKLLQITECVAWLHQHQRLKVQNPSNKLCTRIVAEPTDLQYALKIAQPSLEASLTGLQNRMREALDAFSGTSSHTSRSLALELGLSQDRARVLAKALVTAGYLEVDVAQREHLYLLRPGKGLANLDPLWTIVQGWDREKVLAWIRERCLTVLDGPPATVYLDPLTGREEPPVSGRLATPSPSKPDLDSTEPILSISDSIPPILSGSGSVHDDVAGVPRAGAPQDEPKSRGDDGDDVDDVSGTLPGDSRPWFKLTGVGLSYRYLVEAAERCEQCGEYPVEVELAGEVVGPKPIRRCQACFMKLRGERA